METLLLFTIVFSMASTQSFDWNSISAGGTVADSDRMIRSLELKTAGNGHFDPHFGELAGFECNLNDQSTSYFFDLHYNCEVYSCCDIKEVPISSVRIWTFTLTPTTLHIYCRSDGEGKEANVEVMSVSYSTLSHCIDSDQWASLLNILTINSDDEVTSAYREVCPAGYYRSSNTGTCECEENTISEPGSGFCTPCNPGTLANETKTGCENCVSENPLCPVFCESQEEEDHIYGNYSWPTTEIGYHAQIPCVYNNETMARKFCDGSTIEYEKTKFDNCMSRMDEAIREIQNRADDLETEQDQFNVSRDLQKITENNATFFSSHDVIKVAEILNNLIDFNSDVNFNETVSSNILKSFNDILEARSYEEMARNDAATSMRNSTERFTDRISKDLEKSKENKTFQFLKEDTVAIVVLKNSEDEAFFKVSGENNQLKNSTLGQDDSDDNQDDILFSARVPANEKKSQVTAALFDATTFYPDNTTVQDFSLTLSSFFSDLFKPRNTTATKVASLIAEVKYAEVKEMDGFDDGKKVNMSFSIKDGPSRIHYIMALRPSYQCAYYNTKTGSWVSGEKSGCTSSVVATIFGKETVTCSCNHMTSFAVLMSFDSDYDPVERIVTIILLAASLVCLVLTIIAYLPVKDMTRRRSVKTHLLLATSFILSTIVFYTMEHGVSTNHRDSSGPSESSTASTPCIIIAFLVNYLWLCQMAWMVCEAVMLYLDLIIVFNVHIKRFMLKSNLICWGVPLLFPIIGMIWGQEDFADPTTCFARRKYGLVTFYAPVVICILFNILIFIRIFVSLFWKCTCGKSEEDASKANTFKRRKQLKFAVTLTTILGIAWILGFFLIVDGDSTIWMRWLFIVFNSTQGIFIFILYVVLNDDLKKAWKKLLKISRTSSSSSSSSRGRITATKSTEVGKKKTKSAYIAENTSVAAEAGTE